MPRLDGFLFQYPGLHSLVVVYHDSSDFFYSGHIGTCFILSIEYRACRWYKMHYFTLVVMINQWFMMTCVRTHYVIDMITGLIFAHYLHMIAEKLTFYVDVGLLKIGASTTQLAAAGAGRLRTRKHLKPCHNCGWGNAYAGDFMSVREKKWLKHVYKQCMMNSKSCEDAAAPEKQEEMT